ncbi:MAG: DedA family protein [Thermoplasmata archaeon]
MTLLSGIVEWGIDLIIQGIDYLGYGGIVFFMALESACIPIPSEVIMPLAGHLAWRGSMDAVLAILAGSLGSMLGSLAAYLVGLRLGRPFLERYGKYLLITRAELERAEAWFARYGGRATLIARVVPVVRTFISLPAGIGRMEPRLFTLYSFIGSVPWCALLTYLGYALGDSWRVIFDDYGHFVDAGIFLGILGLVLYFVWKKKRKTGRGK